MTASATDPVVPKAGLPVDAGVIETCTDDIGRRSRTGGLWSLANSVGLIVVRVAVMALTARLINPQDFGTLSGGLILVGLAEVFWSQSLVSGLAQRPVLEQRHIATAMTLSVGMGFLMYTLVVVGRYPLAEFLHLPDLPRILPVLGLVFLIQAFAQVGLSLLQRDLRFREVALSESASYLLSQVLVTLPLALLGFGLWALVWGYVANTALLVGWIGFYVRGRFGFGFEGRALRELLQFGGGQFLAAMASFGAQKGDNIVISRFLGAGALGVYSRGYALMDSVNSILGSVILRVLMPSFARLQQDREKLQQAFSQVYGLVTLLVLPMSLVLLLLARELVAVILGPQWGGAVAVFGILGLGMLFRVQHKLAATLLVGLGRVNLNAWYKFIFMALVVGGAAIGCFTAAPLIAVSWFVLLALFVHAVQTGVAATRLIALSPRVLVRMHLRAVPVTLILCTSVWAFREVARDHGLPPVAIVLGAFVIGAIEAIVCYRFFGRRLWGAANQAALGKMAGSFGARAKRKKPALAAA